MSFRVVVINSSARRTIVEIAATKSLAEVLAAACSKFNVDASEHGLKLNNKQLDLSLPIRLSGLRSGVKLDLVRVPRSSSLVSVALQLPESEARSVPNGRLTDTFPSNTTLWLVLRKFEDAAARNGNLMNLTSRGAPSTNAGTGRLVHQFPVIQILGRELLSFADLQKTFAQLGFNSGSVLLRLSFRTTDRPFEEAMVELEEYFKSVAAEFGPLQPVENSNGESPALPTPEESTPKSTPLSTPSNTDITPEQSTPEPSITQPTVSEPTIPEPTISEPPAATLVSSRPTTVYAPPTNATPQAAQLPFNEEDYEQSMDIVAIQREQLRRARETRLPSNAELEARAAAQAEKLANVREVEIKVRFPDQSQVVSKFSQQDSTESLYCFVRSCLDHAIADEKFTLSYFASGSRALAGKTIIPDSPDKRIIRDLGMEGRVLVNFSWSDEASPTARSSNTDILRVELRQVASQIVVEDYPDLPADEDAKKKEKEKDKGKEKEKDQQKEQKVRSIMQRFGVGGGGGGDQGKKSGGPKKGPSWMNLPGKK
ncbi:hypothetical protein FQN50_001456 [Emmonsiellopsis sp. PD_5]|nr:hypothetical protein FQN50_001456 [Emmonsiellopsis sp. PD_5]